MSEQDVNPSEEQPVLLGADQQEAPIALESDDDEPISLVESADQTQGPSKVRMIGAALEAKKDQFQRPLNLPGTGATRCRVFRAKMAVGPLEALQHQINEWLDGQEIEVKHVCQVIGTVHGKTPEPNLIVTIWY